MSSKPEAKRPAEAGEKHRKPPPSYAHVVVVPIANPKTARPLLELARAVIARDGGRIVALAVITSDGDAEENRDRLDELEAICEEVHPTPSSNDDQGEGEDEDESEDDGEKNANQNQRNDQEIKLDFVTRPANSIARGILDEARETGAELIILGVHKRGHGEVQLGVVAESVMKAAPCDVLVYRHAGEDAFKRVVVPVDGTAASRMAVRMGILIGNSFSGVPVEATHVQPNNRPEYVGRSVIEQTLEDLPGRGVVKRTVLRGHNISQALLSRAEHDQLIVMGFSHRGDAERWLHGRSPTRAVLDNAPGPVLIAVRTTEEVSAPQRVGRRVLGWLRPTLTDVEQEQIVWTAQLNASITLDYVMLMLISSTLASLGLLLNSAAVIIGAMLVAPLMSPLTAFGVGLSTARLDITRHASLTVLLGVVIASVVGIGIGALAPVQSPTTEMMARVSPSLLDAFVALASGVAGSYATARKDIPAALAGVAIAAALVPPICTFGLQVAFGNYLMAMGAMVLFLTNIVSIAVISTGMFVWLGIRPRISADNRRQWVSLMIFTLLSLPMILALLNSSQQTGQASDVERDVRQFMAPIEISDIETLTQDPLLVEVRVQTPYTLSPEAAAAVEQAVSDDIGEPVNLRFIVENIVQAPTQASDPSSEAVDNVGLLVLEDGQWVPRSEDDEDG